MPLFDWPFYDNIGGRTCYSNRQTQEGLGIGLTLVRSPVNMHGGHVEARSGGPGKGSEFVVDLPILKGSTASRRTAGAAGEFPPRRILLVDDNRDSGDAGHTRRIRSTPGYADIVLIALTGWGQEADHRRSRAAGFDHHLVKSPDINKLRDVLTSNWSGPDGRLFS